LVTPIRVARWANVVIAALYLFITLAFAADEAWAFYLFGTGVEAVLLLLIVWYAWTWPRLAD
jgi:hypothetical protein